MKWRFDIYQEKYALVSSLEEYAGTCVFVEELPKRWKAGEGGEGNGGWHVARGVTMWFQPVPTR